LREENISKGLTKKPIILLTDPISTTINDIFGRKRTEPEVPVPLTESIKNEYFAEYRNRPRSTHSSEHEFESKFK
jgi:hypothetical protein